MKVKWEYILILFIVFFILYFLINRCCCLQKCNTIQRFSVGIQFDWLLERARKCFTSKPSEECEFLDEFLEESVGAIDISLDAMDDSGYSDGDAGGAAGGPAGGAAGGAAGGPAGGAAGGVLDPTTLPLSIQIHEFALFVHYQLKNSPDFTFYVQPRPGYISSVLKTVYGELADYKKYESGELKNIERILWESPRYDQGIKIPFDKILQRYNGVVPELYQSVNVKKKKSYKNRHGFQLLDKMEHAKDIHDFYTVVRQYFCNIQDYRQGDYIRNLKTEYPEQNWQEYGSMAGTANFDISDALEFLEYKINNTNNDSDLRRLVKQYVDLFSVQIGDVRICSDELELFRKDVQGTYMIVKLKDPELGFVYDNTEMVVHRCYFELGIPAQYHVGIMRNPSDLIDRKFSKFSRPKYDAIIRLNTQSKMF